MAATLLMACAAERDPINRVEAFALPKNLFAGEWYYQQTVVDVPATYTVSMVGNTNYRGMHRIRWDVQQDYLYARKAYNVVKDARVHPDQTPVSEDTGEYMGDIVGAWKITSHFDIKRGYNPRTGEQDNTLVENTSDCKWFDCKYMRVDWAKNYAVDYMFLDSDEDVVKMPVSFYNQDQDPRWKPIFDADAGYIDITTAMSVDPGYTEMSGRTYPTCWFFAYSHASCNTQIIKIRNSFLRRDPNHDYEPREHTAPFNEWFGFFTNERFQWENHYTLTYRNQRQMINRHNLWRNHHYDAVACTSDDDCKNYGAGSTCDSFVPFHKDDVVTDTDHDSIPDSYENATAKLDDWKGKPPLSPNSADTNGNGIKDADDDLNGNGVRDVEDYWKYARGNLHNRCTIPYDAVDKTGARVREPRPVAYFNTGFFPRDLVCDKGDTGTGPCRKKWEFTNNRAVRLAQWSSVHHVSNDYDDAFWKIFLRGAWGWSDADYQRWIANKNSANLFSGTQKSDLQHFGDDAHGYYAFVICRNNPVQDDDPWPCRFPKHTWSEAKDLISKGLTYNTLSYKQAIKLIDAGKKDTVTKRPAPYIREGDIRYSMINYVKDYYDGWRLLGLGPSHTDPRTGENIAGVANVYALNDWAATRIQEQVQLLNGDIGSVDYVNGVNLENFMQKVRGSNNAEMRADSVTAGQLEEIYGAMVQPWMKKVPRTGSPELLDTYVKQYNQRGVRMKMFERVTKAGMFDPKRSQINHTAIRGTPLEKRLVDSDVLLAAGYAPASVKSISEDVLKTASPVRATGLFKFLEDQEEWRFQMANKRNMYFIDMADDAMQGLAWRLAQKYKDKSVAERAQSVWLEARDSIMRAVLTHEMGHTVGLHHNWGGSEDVMNFHPEYWTLRTDNYKNQKLCSQWKNTSKDDGQLCPFFLKGKEMNDFQLGKSQENINKNIDGLYEYAYSSVMDYAGRYVIDDKGLGRYDVAAILYGHVDKMEAFKDTTDGRTGVSVPKGRPSDASRINIFEEWSDRDGSILAFTGQGPQSFHYTNWWGIMKDNLIKESNRQLIPYQKFVQYCYNDQKNGGNQEAGVPCTSLGADERRDIGYFASNGNDKLVRVPYVFCTYTRGNISDGCNTRDFGSDQYERMKQHVDSWDTWVVMKNFTRYQFPWDGSKYVSNNYGRTYKVLKNFNNAYSLYQGLFRQWFSETMIQNFFTDPVWGWGSYTLAMDKAFNMAMQTLAMPDIKNFEKGTWADGQQIYREAEYRIDFRSDLSNSRYFATAWYDTNYEDNCGLQFWQCLHHVGFYLDKMMSIQVLTDPVTYFVARDTAEDIREWRISFFDNYTTQIVDFFGALLSEDFDKFSPFFDPAKPYNGKQCTSAADCGTGGKCETSKNSGQKECVCGNGSCIVTTEKTNSLGTRYVERWVNGMAWRHYTADTQDVQKPSTGAAVEASTRFTLQMYAVVFGMLDFQQNFDNEFVARGRMWKEGSKNTITIKPNTKVAGMLKFEDPFTGHTYVGVDYKDDRGISEKMIKHANKMKARTSYCTKPTTPPQNPAPLDLCVTGVSENDKKLAETELYNYTQLMDILIQVTAIYDNGHQNWSDDYQNP